MDPLASLLDGPRANGAFLMRSLFEPPWSLRIRDEAPMTIVTVVRGRAWAVAGDDAPVRLREGDIAVFRGPDHYTVADAPQTAPKIVIHPGQRCAAPDGTPLDPALHLGRRTWGTGTENSTILLTGTYEQLGAVSQPLLDALPPVLVLPGELLRSPLVEMLHREIVRDDPGQEAVLDRLLDLLAITVLRAWFDRPGAEVPAWYRGHCDPVIGPALQAIHNTPERPWTVASLAAECGLSRAALARRFGEVVGEPPLAYLTARRLALAADLLLERGSTVASVADRVGYGSAFAFSSAFKRVRGISPAQHRTMLVAA
jgi:AraC-like DNA-binding protein